MNATNQALSQTERPPTNTKPSKAKAAKSKQVKPTKAAAKQTSKGVVPSHEGSMAAFMDDLVQKTTEPKALEEALADEAKRRGVKAMTLGGLRSHVKYRQARGKLVGIEIKAE